MEVRVHDHDVLARLLVLQEADHCAVVSLEVVPQIVLGPNIIIIDRLLLHKFKLVRLISNENSIHISSVVELAVVAMLLKFGLVDLGEMVYFLEADYVGEATAVVEDFLDDTA